MKTNKYQLISINVPANSTGTRYNFPDQPNLRTAGLTSVATYSDKAISIGPNGEAVSPIEDFKKAYLVLVNGNQEDIFRIPLVELNRVVPNNFDATEYVPAITHLIEFMGQQIDWSKSYIQLGSAPSVSTAFSFFFGIYYN